MLLVKNIKIKYIILLQNSASKLARRLRNASCYPRDIIHTKCSDVSVISYLFEFGNDTETDNSISAKEFSVL